jgi:hypothetical protein
MIQAKARVLDPSVQQLMKDNPSYSFEFELTTPEKKNIGVNLDPEEIFSYNTTKSKQDNLFMNFHIFRW